MRIALYPGSFDPVTNGHIDVIRRTAALFDRVVVLVSVNVVKQCLFSAEERVAMLRRAAQGFDNVTVEAFEGLVAHYARDAGIAAIVKGLRDIADFEKECKQARINRQLCPAAETLFLPAESGTMHLSSTMVKQVCALGGDIRPLVPAAAYEQIIARIHG